MTDQILEKNILINKIEKTLTQTRKQLIKVRDENNLGYQLWPIKADGTESKAYQFFKTLPMDGMGMNVKISFKEEQGDYNGKPVTYRTIIGMKEAAQASLGSKIAKQGQANDKVEKEEKKWERVSWGKCKTLFLVESFKALVNKSPVYVPTDQDLERIEKSAEAWADMSMRALPKTPAEEFGINVDDIKLDEPPF